MKIAYCNSFLRAAKNKIDMNRIDRLLSINGVDINDEELNVREQIDELIKMFEGFTGEIKIYRTLGVRDLEEIDIEDIGHHWSYSDDASIEFASHTGNKSTALVEATINAQYVDWEETVVHNYLIEEEHEIFIPYENFDKVKIINKKML